MGKNECQFICGEILNGKSILPRIIHNIINKDYDYLQRIKKDKIFVSNWFKIYYLIEIPLSVLLRSTCLFSFLQTPLIHATKTQLMFLP